MTPSSESGDRPGGTWSWTALWSTVLLLPCLVLLPLLQLPLGADHRFNIFLHGGLLSQRPWEVLTGPLASVPNYLEHGNFRPLGRMVEQAQDLVVFSLGRWAEVPFPLALRLVALLFAGLLCAAAVLWVETVSRQDGVRRGGPSAAGALMALVVPLFLVGTTWSAVVLYTSLYACSAAIVLLVASWAARRDWFGRRRAGVPVLAVALLLGAAMAAFNEITYVAVPLAAVSVLVRGLLTLRLRPRQLLRSAAVRVWVAMTVGFLAVLVPVRLLIAQQCGGGGCYAASDLSLSAAAWPALGHRLLSILPPQAWQVIEPAPAAWAPTAEPVPLVSIGLIAVLVLVTTWQVARRPLPSGRGITALLLGGLLLLVGSSLAMALTTGVQLRVSGGQWPVGSGWRDQFLAAAGAGAVLVALACVAARLARAGAAASGGTSRLRQQLVRGAGVVVTGTLLTLVGAGLVISLTVNTAVHAQERPAPEGDLFDRISRALQDYEAGTDQQRCALLTEFAEIYPRQDYWHLRLARGLEAASQAWYAAPFCTRADTVP